MKKILAPIVSIATFFIVIFILSYVFPPVMKFVTWWFITKEEVNASINTGQAILIDIITHLVTYAAVGAIFGFLGWFDSDAMHYAYVVISEVIALALAILMRFILDYYWIIFIILGILVAAAITMVIILKAKEKKKEEAK